MTVFLVLLLILPMGVFSQDTTRTSIGFGVRYSFYYNYKVIHHTPCFSLDIRRHNVYAGFQATSIIKPIGDPVDVYEKNTYGINLGYRYTLSNNPSAFHPFAQLNFSVYQIEYIEYQQGPPFSTLRKKLVVENTASIGLEYVPFKWLRIFSGIGFGSFSGFFLVVDSFTPTSYIGVEYKF